MQYLEFGDPRAQTVLLLHGGGLGWWNYRDAAALLQRDCHVVLPILDGHAGSDRPFTTVEDNAAELLSWIDAHCGGRVSLLGGLSLGGQVLLELLSLRRDVCACALVESAAVLPSGLTNALIAPAFGSSYGLIRRRSFARLQFRSLHIREDLFEDYYRDTCRIGKADMIAFLQASTAYALKPALRDTVARVHVFYGERENRRIRKSAAQIGRAVPSAALHPLPGYVHGEFSINHGQAYAAAVLQLLEGGTDCAEFSFGG